MADIAKSPVEWFANQKFPDIEDVAKFTRTYGLLRANWTYGALGGNPESDQFAMPVSEFMHSHRQFLRYWKLARSRARIGKVLNWINRQLGRYSQAKTVSHPDKMGRQYQPVVSLKTMKANKGELEIHLVAGDLWQGLCCELLQVLSERQGMLRICKNCGNRFVTTDSRKEFCDRPDLRGNNCAKLFHNRLSAQRRRTRERSAKS